MHRSRAMTPVQQQVERGAVKKVFSSLNPLQNVRLVLQTSFEMSQRAERRKATMSLVIYRCVCEVIYRSA